MNGNIPHMMVVSSGLVVTGRDSSSRGPKFESHQRTYTGWIVFNIYL